MVAKKLTDTDVEDIKKLLLQGMSTKECAKRYGVHQSTIQTRCKNALNARAHPLDIKLKIIKKVKEGYSKAEAGLMFGVSPHTVIMWTKDIPGYKYAGDYIIRKNGIELLQRLLRDGCLINDFVVSTVRGLQKHFPLIKTARFKEKTIFYLEGRENETIEAYFRDQPGKIINYSTVKELSLLLGVETSRKQQKSIIDKYKQKHDSYWRSRRRQQKKLEDMLNPYSLGKLSWNYFKYL